MTILAERVDFVIGVDTHKRSHVAAVVSSNGGKLDEREVAATQAGYEELVDFADQHRGRRAWAIEGTSSYGAGLSRLLVARGEEVIEIDSPRRSKRRMGAKSDAIDAVRAARDALGQDRHATPKHGDTRAALSVLLAARSSAVDAYTTAQRQLHDLVVTCPEPLRAKLRNRTPRSLLSACEHLRQPAHADIHTATTVSTLRSLAKRIRTLEREAKNHHRTITELVQSWRGDLLELFGVGPIGAATILCSWSHPERIHNEAAFAMLAGVAPLPASSGQITRNRLNRFGDRQLNRVLHVIVQHRMQRDPTTKAYVQRRRADGKTTAEIRRSLKRYIARQLYRQLQNPPITT
jgi:transposase